MPAYQRTIKVPGKKSDAIYRVISEKIDAFLEKLSVGDFELTRHDGKKKIDIASKLFSATLICRDGEVELDGKLSLFAAPFKGKIDDGIDRWVKKNLDA